MPPLCSFQSFNGTCLFACLAAVHTVSPGAVLEEWCSPKRLMSRAYFSEDPLCCNGFGCSKLLVFQATFLAGQTTMLRYL